MGIQVAMSWDAGIELIAPLPDRDSFVKQLMETRGEGIVGVVFAVDDVEQARQAAERRGIAIYYTVDYSQDEIDQHLQGRFRKYKEYMLDPSGTYGAGPVIGQIEPK